MTLIEILTANAQFVSNSNVQIYRSPSQSYVDMCYNQQTFCYLQGQEADEFNDECERLWDEVGELGMNVVELAMCYDYLHLIGE